MMLHTLFRGKSLQCVIIQLDAMNGIYMNDIVACIFEDIRIQSPLAIIPQVLLFYEQPRILRKKTLRVD